MSFFALCLAAFYAFDYGGRPAEGLEQAKIIRTVHSDSTMRKVVREWTSPDGKLVLRSTETEYPDFQATEYVPELICRGDAPTEIVDGFQPLALRRASAKTTLRALRGTVCTERDFAAESAVLGTGRGETNAFAMVATEGRSSAQWMPWWGVDFASGEGLEIGLGWTGAWRADFAADGTNVSMSAGMVKTHFRLYPGETLRQPSLLVFRRQKGVSPREMQTLIHRFMVNVKSPRDRKGELIHGISALTAGGGNKTPAMMKKVIDWKKANEMPFDCFWVDAGWNGPAHLPDLISNCGNMWLNFTGDWRFNPTVHPDGDLGKVADAAHAAGLRMLLWMEPERCVSDPPPPVFREHRDWILPRDDKMIRNKHKLLVDFGNPAALAWVTDVASEHVRRCKLDVFRQDFNLNSLPIWQANDAPDRQGITEAKHIMGLWRFWDTLRERFPHLVIENCASGGRRLDFEAVSRGHSYCRTDYAIYHRDSSQITDVQNVTLNTLAYVPFQGSESTPALIFDDYGIFSSFASGNVFTPSDWNAGIVKNDFTPEQIAWFKTVFAVGRRMMPFYEGDYYPLTDSRAALPKDIAWLAKNEEEMRWCAWQLHRPDQAAGFAIFFRRLNAPNHIFEADLGGIDAAADYEVEEWAGKTIRMSGRELRHRRIELRSPRSFKLIFYRKLGPSAGLLSAANAQPVKVIFDSDMLTDFDDVGALACLHALADKGECEILATISSTRANASVGAMEVVNAYYGRPDIPVGCARERGVRGDGVTPDRYPDHLKYRKLISNYAAWVRHPNSDDAPDANAVYRKVLSAQPDHSVVICSVGFLTNLRRLLETPPDELSELNGRDLVSRKVKTWVAMGFAYPRGREYNIMWDADSARVVLANWPTPAVFSDGTYGGDVFAGRALLDSKGADNPVREVFSYMPSRDEIRRDPILWHRRHFGLMGRASWDETAVLAAVRGVDSYFNVHRGKFVIVDDKGTNEWIDDEEQGPHVRLTERVHKAEVGRIIDSLICQQPSLICQQPKNL